MEVFPVTVKPNWKKEDTKQNNEEQEERQHSSFYHYDKEEIFFPFAFTEIRGDCEELVEITSG